MLPVRIRTHIHRHRLIPDCIILRPTGGRTGVRYQWRIPHGTASPAPRSRLLDRRGSYLVNTLPAEASSRRRRTRAHRPRRRRRRRASGHHRREPLVIVVTATDWPAATARLSAARPTRHLRVTEIRCPDRPRFGPITPDRGTTGGLPVRRRDINPRPDPVPCRSSPAVLSSAHGDGYLCSLLS